MSSDYTRPDGDLFDPQERARVLDEVDAILGQVIDGRYEVISRLGQGGMGFVWEARDLVRDGLPVVLKTLRPELVDNEKTAERFTREAMASATMDHENVIRVLGHGVTRDYGAYYVMERLVGADLGRAMEALGGPLSVARTFEIATQVAAALGAAHARGIVHRDLKPENVFLADRGGREVVKVLDFGLARLLDSGDKLTETGAVIGTPRYMAPEQCQGEKADPRADVYSLGLVMHEMLTGQQPYRALGTYEILGKKMFEDMPAPSALERPVVLDARLEAFVMRCLARNPADRPADGARMLEELVALREAVLSAPTTVASSPPPRITAPPTLPSRPPMTSPVATPASRPPARRSRAGLFAALAAVAVLLALGGLGVGAYLLFGRPRVEPIPPPAPALAAPAPVAPPAPAPAGPRIEVTSEPAGAEVRTSDGRVLGVTPLPLRIGEDVADGASVEILLTGYAPRTIAVWADVPTAHVTLHAEP
ncbi:MAG: serine/threonine protein kinase [Sandaracinaceae bacterium]|nr:serine/threonine protein kinase [Sandaracinaceae bacterium]